MEPQIQYAKTSDGVSIAYYTMGQGPPLVSMALPSHLQAERNLPGERRTFEDVSRIATLVRYDHRGFGLSERDCSTFPLDALLSDLEAVVDKLGLTTFVLFARGGFTAPVAIRYAAAHPERVSQLVLMLGFARIPPPFHQQVQALLLSGSDWRFVSESLMRLTLGWEDEEYSREFAALWREAVTYDTYRAFWRDAGQWDVRDLLPNVVMPTLVINATQSRIAGPEQSREIASLMPDARVAIADGTTALERLAQIQAPIASFLRGPDAARTEPGAAAVPSPYSASVTARLEAVPPLTFAAGRYTVTRLLGEGAQKTVYLVHDAALERDCALALLKTEVLDADGLARVRREGQAMARLSHPNVVGVYDIGDEGGRPYLVCEYVRGGDLRQELDRAGGPLPLPRALAIAGDVCCALAFAHSQGIIHRDVKPGNVHLAADGSAKLGDFGLALAADQSRLTMAGTAMGTAPYMAPEQARGQPVDARSDLYSLGCLLYELIAGRPPFVGDDPMAVVSQHVHAVPEPPSTHNPEIPHDLERLVLSLLAKAREERPSSADEALAALRVLEDAQAAPAPAARPRLSAARMGSASPRIRYVTTADGIRIAYATLGEGPPFVSMPDSPWFHLQLNWQQPEFRRFFERLARNMTLVRYDARGHGLSQRDVDDYSLEAYLLDLEAVVDHLDLEHFVLFGLGASVPVAITYAARLPERVSHLILYGFARGADFAGSPQVRSLGKLLRGDWELYTETAAHVALGWEAGEPARRFAAVMRECVSQEAAVKAMAASMRFDVTDLLGEVSTPTLILHPRQAKMLPVEASEELAARMSNAHLVLLEGESHAVYLGEERAREFVEAVEEFVGVREAG